MDTVSNLESVTKYASLAERIQGGDVNAEEELFSTYRRSVFLIARVRTRDAEAARDLTQDVFIAVLEAIRKGQLREPGKLAAFIQGTARNLINNFLRSRARHVECDLPDEELRGADLLEELELAERKRLIQHEIELLASVDRQILVWSLLEERSLAEIAVRLNLSHDAVRARKSRLVRKIVQKIASLSQKQLL